MTLARTAGKVVVLALALAPLLAGCDKAKASQGVTVAAAMSLRGVMPELVQAYASHHPGAPITVTYGASGELEQQVKAGAPVDAVVLAATQPVDELVSQGRAVAASRRVVASNELLLVAEKPMPGVTFATLGRVPKGELIALGDPRTVPAGRYAEDYLVTLGEWDSIASRTLLGSSVAAVLVYVRRGEAAVAIVYRSELHGITDLVVLDVARGKGAPRPEVVAAAMKNDRHDADDFLSFVASPAALPLFESFGFGQP